MDNIKALLVEDIAIASKIAILRLQNLGCNLDLAENGQQALTLFKKNDYDIVFMDLGLPDMSGVDVIKKIREIENNEEHVPIIVLTANLDELYKKECLAAGMDDLIVKPLNNENGQAIIDKFIKRASSI